MAVGAYNAWLRARRDRFDEWMRATDPKNLQPRIRPLFRELAEHLRNHPPADVPQPVIEEAIDAVMAPWGVRYEREFRPIMRDNSLTDKEKSSRILDKVHELGMSPYAAPEPLPLIDQSEISLVCWMAVRG